MNEKIKFQVKDELLCKTKTITNKAPICLMLLLAGEIIRLFLMCIGIFSLVFAFFVPRLFMILLFILLYSWIGISLIMFVVLIVGIIISIKDGNFKIMYLNFLVVNIVSFIIMKIFGVAIKIIVGTSMMFLIETLNFLGNENFFIQLFLLLIFLGVIINAFNFGLAMIVYNITTGRKRQLKELLNSGYTVVDEELLSQDTKDFIKKSRQKGHFKWK